MLGIGIPGVSLRWIPPEDLNLNGSLRYLSIRTAAPSTRQSGVPQATNSGMGFPFATSGVGRPAKSLIVTFSASMPR